MAKLSDFGEAKVKGLNTTKLRLTTIVGTTSRPGAFMAGTVAYQAPEILSEAVRETSRVAEMYSFGVVTWECLKREIPHRGKKESSITILALKKNVPMLSLPNKPSHALTNRDANAWRAMHQVASACLSRNRSARLTSSVVVALWHGFQPPKEVVEAALSRPQFPSQSDVEIQTHTQPTQPTTGDIAPDSPDNKHLTHSVEQVRQQSFVMRHWKALLVLGAVICVGVVVGAVVAASGGSDSNGASPSSSPHSDPSTPTNGSIPGPSPATTPSPTFDLQAFSNTPVGRRGRHREQFFLRSLLNLEFYYGEKDDGEDDDYFDGF